MNIHKRKAILNDRRDLLARMTTSSDELLRFRLVIEISAMNLFGQDMFIVDVNHEEAAHIEKREHNLSVPESSIQGIMVGPLVERDLSSE
jgi:hypothetical protein